MAKPTKNGGAPAEETLEKILDAVNGQTKRMDTGFTEMKTGFANVASQITKTNERIDTLAAGTQTALVRIETRLEEIARNTGARQRYIETRLKTIEERLGIQPPPQPPE